MDKPSSRVLYHNRRRAWDHWLEVWVRGCVLLLCALVCAGQGISARAEIIRSFDVDIHLRKDTTLDVAETIVMDFEDAQKHGIYRIIPVRYTRYGNTYTTPLQLQSVTSETGARWKYTTARQGSDLNIRIGDPDRTLSGVHIYRLRYTLRRAVNFFGGAPEVYWNATGNEWPFAMRRVSARFYPPPGVSPQSVRTASYVGVLGARTPGDVRTAADHITFSTTDLKPGEGLTIVAGLPAGSVTPPPQSQILLWWLADWWPLVVFPALAFGLIVLRWARTGRDVDGGRAVAVEWSPPSDLTPAEVGTLVDERCDLRDIVSTLIDLAARGYLTIEETVATKLFFFSSKDYTFVRTIPSPEKQGPPLLPHETQFLNGLFAGGNDRVTLSSLKEKFYTHLPGIRKAIYESLTDKKLFASNPETTRSSYKSLGIALIVLGFIGITAGAAAGFLAYGLGAVISGVIVLFFVRAMPSKTALGSRKLRECLGFQRFVRLAEKDRIAVLAREDPTIFGRLLPYAMVLGVADQWADAFRDLLTEPPDWYQPYDSGSGYVFSSRSFVHDLGGGMNTMASTFSSAPSSRGGSGGSGFSGGGGSGGGFGGGGGGSW